MIAQIIKKTSSFLCILGILFAFSACGSVSYGHAELTLSLPEEYREIEAEGFDRAYENGEALVGIVRISFEASFNQGIPDTYMPREFASFYMNQTGKDLLIEMKGNVPYYEYIEESKDGNQYYLASFYRSKHAYFVILFACPQAKHEAYRPLFLSYTQSIWFEQ